jgi:hypothetical protein
MAWRARPPWGDLLSSRPHSRSRLRCEFAAPARRVRGGASSRPAKPLEHEASGTGADRSMKQTTWTLGSVLALLVCFALPLRGQAASVQETARTPGKPQASGAPSTRRDPGRGRARGRGEGSPGGGAARDAARPDPQAAARSRSSAASGRRAHRGPRVGAAHGRARSARDRSGAIDAPRGAGAAAAAGARSHPRASLREHHERSLRYAPGAGAERSQRAALDADLSELYPRGARAPRACAARSCRRC